MSLEVLNNLQSCFGTHYYTAKTQVLISVTQVGGIYRRFQGYRTLIINNFLSSRTVGYLWKYVNIFHLIC